MKKKIVKDQQISFLVNKDVYQKYQQHKRQCNIQFTSTINRVYNNLESKGKDNGAKNKKTLWGRISTEIDGILTTLEVMKEYNQINGPWFGPKNKNKNYNALKFLTVISGLGTSCLSQFNLLREMLEIKADSTNIKEILQINPFIFGNKTFVDRRHYILWNGATNVKNKTYKIYDDINKMASSLKKESPNQSIIELILSSFRQKEPELLKIDIEIVEREFNISKKDAKLIYDKKMNNKIEFSLPGRLPSEINYSYTEYFNKWIDNLHSFFNKINKTIQSKRLDVIVNNKQKLWYGYKNKQ